jgi:hypothetical protein
MFDLSSSVDATNQASVANVVSAFQSFISNVGITTIDEINFDVCYSMLSSAVANQSVAGSGSTALNVLIHSVEAALLEAASMPFTDPVTGTGHTGATIQLGSNVSYSYESSFYPLFSNYSSYGTPPTAGAAAYQNNFFPNSVVISAVYS